MTHPYSVIETIISALENDFKLKSGTKFISPLLTIKVTRRLKPYKRNLRNEFVVTIGKPNYSALAFIKDCKKAKEPFPVQKIQFTPYPKKKLKAKATKSTKKNGSTPVL